MGGSTAIRSANFQARNEGRCSPLKRSGRLDDSRRDQLDHAGSLDAAFQTAAAMDYEIVVFTADEATWSIQRGVIDH